MDPATRRNCTDDQLPSCDTGPAGRFLFVVREISQAVSRHRIRAAKVERHAVVASTPAVTESTENNRKHNLS